MIDDYAPFVDRMVSRYEGGYGWDPNDPGGPTKYGITCYDLAEYLGRVMDSMTRWAPIVRNMTLSTAEHIYAEKYAVECAFNELNVGVDCAVFDFGVNSGPSRAIRCCQAIVGVQVDGLLGPVTLKAINAANPQDFVNQLCNARLKFLRSLRIWGTFGKGWYSRVEDLRSYCTGLLNPKRPQLYVKKSHRIPLAFAKGYPPK